MIKDDRYNFKTYFNLENGDYLRTGILDENGTDSGIEPFKASFPHLLDIGIMGHCKRGLLNKCKVDCYQSGKYINEPNMSLGDYKDIIMQSEGRVFQVALGGRGDPDEHENFEEILYFTREHNIIPNLTSSGYFFTREKAKIIKRYCGACAISFYEDEHSDNAVSLLLSEGVTTNIHFVLGNNSIDKAIYILENINKFEGINRFIFLLYKPIGQGTDTNILDISHEKLKYLVELMEDNIDKIGFDSCFVPAIVNLSSKIDVKCFDFCEAGRFSCYISPDFKISPCSFERTKKFDIDLKNYSIEDAWNSKLFDSFTAKFKTSCPQCKKREFCMGGCPITNKITLCKEGGQLNEI